MMNKFNPIQLENIEQESKNSKVNTRLIPISPGEKLGGEFHLIMQQIGLGLPVEPLLEAYPQIDKWVKAVKPFLEIPGSKEWNAEVQYLYKLQLLHANYDLIIYQDKQVIGIDWTIQKLSNFQVLENSLNTQLRLFLLHEKTQLPPEHINLIYLFVNTDNIYQFTYSQVKNQVFKERLLSILKQFFVEDIAEETQQEDLEIIHQRWMNKEISTQEYLDAIPEVEL
ncbi:hypothetical protein QUB80_22845 [Chlorogloeopsis sp. ULAP01]|uniref:hypothetical protein n=1 Tax=Chlorogloeopsis sp. ULAP01 TaxID=3056483 RepID=UPI0025AB22EC|nr:hypothetical protein [Chlorogloeopsis sp. ULAP01]MDM9383529.1 hypothetical protein [Chlorogloeopsis sp. ULAP01]